jgi:hypothetical protein
MSAANLRTLAMPKHPLLVRCRKCNKHAVIEIRALGASEHSMEPLSGLVLQCSRCGNRDVELQVTRGAPTVAEWLSRSSQAERHREEGGSVKEKYQRDRHAIYKVRIRLRRLDCRLSCLYHVRCCLALTDLRRPSQLGGMNGRGRRFCGIQR